MTLVRDHVFDELYHELFAAYHEALLKWMQTGTSIEQDLELGVELFAYIKKLKKAGRSIAGPDTQARRLALRTASVRQGGYPGQPPSEGFAECHCRAERDDRDLGRSVTPK